MVTIADRLNWLLTERHMSLNQLSIESGIAYMTLSNLVKSGGEQTRLPTLRKLAEYFGITLDELVYGSEREQAWYKEHDEMQKVPTQNERELTEKDKQIIGLLPFVPDGVKDGMLMILSSTVDLAAAAESAKQDMELLYSRRAQADSDDIQAELDG